MSEEKDSEGFTKKAESLSNEIEKLRARISASPEVENQFLHDPLFADFQIKTSDKTFPVIKYELAKSSPVFEAMFRSGFKENEDGFVRLEDDSEAVEIMLRHIYCNFHIQDFEIAEKVVPLAHCYEIKNLKDKCELAFIEELSPENLPRCLGLANIFDLPLLQAQCGLNLLMSSQFVETPNNYGLILHPPVVDFRKANTVTHVLANLGDQEVACILSREEHKAGFSINATKVGRPTDFDIVARAKDSVKILISRRPDSEKPQHLGIYVCEHKGGGLRLFSRKLLEIPVLYPEEDLE